MDQLLAWLKTASTYELPSYSELPHVPLYMEQVTAYVNSILSPINPGNKDLLTSFMVNNYVKAGIMSAPDKKKYSVDQLGYLLALSTLKTSLSISEIALLIEMDSDVSSDKSVLYGFFRVMAKDILKDVAGKASSKATGIAEHYQKMIDANDPDSEKYLRDSLGLIALRMSIQAGVYQIVSRTILDSIGQKMHGADLYLEENQPGHKEKRREEKITAAQSKRVALAKKAKLPVKAKDKKEK